MTTIDAGGPYTERSDPPLHEMDRALLEVYGAFAARFRGRRASARLAESVRRVEIESKAVASLTDLAIREALEAIRTPWRRAMREGKADLEILPRIFAMVREMSGRVLGLRHYPCQLMGGFAMIGGALAEMQTGEGKTITAVLPAVAMALTGAPVHIVTVNDYLAKRDFEELRPLYRALGLSVGLIEDGEEPPARRAAYAKDVTFCTNKQIVFDYLRDRILLGQHRSKAGLLIEKWLAREGACKADFLLLRGLHFAIVDEADSVLIDEARTPLILSGSEPENEEAAALYKSALDIARSFAGDDDFSLDAKNRSVHLTRQGHARLGELAAKHASGLWASHRARAELIERALSALHLYHRDLHYIDGEDGKIQIVDEFTGRTMPDREWEQGLHQMIEVKEGKPLSPRRRTLARLTYQRFFRRYVRFCGMTGTGAEAAGELWSVYGLAVTPIPTNRPSIRRDLGTRLLARSDEKWRAIVESIRQKAVMEGRPVLLGTRSVGASEHAGNLLREAGIENAVVLNARQDRDEARIIAEAGKPGRVTVATNMAGRGTDIRLDPASRSEGGLHVILTEFHESSRIDRQLFGRCGRQGDPGSTESIVALDDELFARFASAAAMQLAKRLHRSGPSGDNSRLALALRGHAQARAERQNSRIRRATVAQDRRLDRSLAFAGKPE